MVAERLAADAHDGWALARQARGNQVTLVHRGPALSRASEANRSRLEELRAGGALELIGNGEVTRIEPQTVHLTVAGQPRELANDYVFVCAGGELPVPFLQQLGIAIERKFGER